MTKNCRSACGNQHVTTNMSLLFLLGELGHWLLALGLLIIALLMLYIGNQRKHAKPEEEKISTPTPVEPIEVDQIEIVEVGQKNTVKGVTLARSINRTALYNKMNWHLNKHLHYLRDLVST